MHENDIALMEDGVVELGKEGSLLLSGIAGLGGLLEAFGGGLDIASAVDETTFDRQDVGHRLIGLDERLGVSPLQG